MKILLEFLENKKNKGAYFEEIKNIFGKEILEDLKLLQKEGKIVEIRKNYFISLKRTPFAIGKVFFQGKNLFVETEKEEYFFPSNPLKLMEGDLVLLKKEKGRVRIFKILERAEKKLIGFYLGEKNFQPLKRLKEEFILNKPLNLPYGSLIETEILFYPDRKRKGVLSFKNLIGKFGCTKDEIFAFCLSRNLPYSFPEKVLEEAKVIKKEENLRERVDFTEKEIFTIDPKDAKDFDDGISLEEEGENFILGVHIADVTHYVEENSEIDREATLRAETLYFPTQAVHMLPPLLSENLCSLKEKEKRLAVSVLMYFDKRGKHLKTEFVESVINSKKRFTYEEAEEILEGKRSKFSKTLKRMEKLSEILKEKRLKKGGLEFEFPEMEMEYDSKGNLIGVLPLERLKSHSIVEEFMLFANREVARFLFRKNYPLLYRIHPKPDPMKLLDLKVVCQKFGLDFSVNLDEPTPKMLQKVLEKWKNEKDGPYLQELLLRALPRAIYSPKRDIHFALNFETYCHFTSPIRRYADIIVHRSLKRALKGIKYERNDLERVSEHLNT
ncbi:MAG: RNB domain-containing ribonuclease, partial [Thermoanaerobaculia bacterium]